MKRYEGLDITVFRTDRHGAVTVTTDGNNIEVKPFLRETNAQD
jgi:beta-lactamase superfamily II metal-dependent hydrolase